MLSQKYSQILRTTFLEDTVQKYAKMKSFIKDFFSKFDQIRSFLRIWSDLLNKSLMENFIFCAAKHL